MTTAQITWLAIACLLVVTLGPILFALRLYFSNKRGKDGELPEGFRFMVGSISLGQKAFTQLRNPFAQEDADLAELAELTDKLRQEDEASN
ncbi:MAG: hypothetical protein DWQ07_04010 [Chloroflexi bacterium]|nr:MAG: hypothetical protein DWQ07_04010 [Chloroflexota bacterium]MBL1193333.1 hypothetical protein [Chloroflexota bacterium]NOH10625.1 hypothetical protein [Chloroflexota bacterium]